MRLLVAIAAVLFLTSMVGAADWQRYTDPEFGYSIDLPADQFDVETDAARNGLTLYEREGRGQIDVYALQKNEELNLDQLREELSHADRIRQVTYSRSGESWFVISGYYRRLADDATDLIFYAKFMLSADRRSLSAFEVSYPVSDKRRYDPIVERIEDSLTRPLS